MMPLSADRPGGAMLKNIDALRENVTAFGWYRIVLSEFIPQPTSVISRGDPGDKRKMVQGFKGHHPSEGTPSIVDCHVIRFYFT
jgi:hypothetical protein